MPIWLIEVFGAHVLDRGFVLILLMTAPAWLAMILAGRSVLVRRISQPLLLAPLYALVLCVFLWKSYQFSLLPDPLDQINYEAAQDFARHPVSFLALFCNLQILNLCVGTMMFQKAIRSGIQIPVELLLCWFFGAVALIPFSVRLLLGGKVLKS